jgi:hypothetical protein
VPRRPLRDNWDESSDDTLLDIRMCDLPLAVEGTMADRIAQLRGELEARGLRFPLHFYLSDEWFTPDGGTSIAVPFYLGHPRLEASFLTTTTRTRRPPRSRRRRVRRRCRHRRPS